MRNSPFFNQQTLEALEACRPGRDDAHDPSLGGLAAELAVSPELEELHGRLQKLDATLAGAFQDIRAPAGLRERLLTGLAAAAPAYATPGVLVAAAPLWRRRLGRKWPLVAGAAVAAAILIVAAWLGQGAHCQYSAGDAMTLVIERFTSDSAQFGGGQLVSAVSPPRAYPMSCFVRWPAQTHWRPVGRLLDAAGVAYDMRSGEGWHATLYVLDCRLPDVPSVPPARPAHWTANCSAAAWQEQGLLYVVVVQGDWRAYQQFLDLPTGPVT